jgi:hypothetical protein
MNQEKHWLLFNNFYFLVFPSASKGLLKIKLVEALVKKLLAKSG